MDPQEDQSGISQRRGPYMEIVKRLGRPTLKIIREREAASQIGQGCQRTLKEEGYKGPRLRARDKVREP